jgi:hypothetical protein
MTTSQPFFNTNFTNTIGDPTKNRQIDGTGINSFAGVHGSQLASEIHGKYFEVAKRGQLFIGSTLIAGVALPVNAATLVSKFTLWNPAGSGYDVELVEFAIGFTSATEVIGGICLGLQTKVSTSGGNPGTLTALTPVAGYAGGSGSNKAALYSAATLTNAAVLPVYALGMNFSATSGPTSGANSYVFDGKIVLPPDTIATFVTNIAAETAATCSLSWAEWPM